MTEPKKGDHVSWKSHGGTAHGVVEKKQTSPTTIKGHKVAASTENPEFIVRSDNGGKAAHKSAALTKA
ncbi:DUF2945 domain-containing protein [Sphingomonas sp. RB3P16]|uniref:DUF2945 domain-containing protein n=1 Tax=Parasphingomonas frigoris TaxID=3096163 RepID=UPI002FCA8CCC